jgi:RimJ/RimL family protein N-acetyltransferase
VARAARRLGKAIAPFGPRRDRRLGPWIERLRALRRGGDLVSDEPNGAEQVEPHGRLVREGRLVRLRAHVPANRGAFQRWYADEEIVRLLRHDQTPLTSVQSRGYFDSIILPLSARGLCFAIHESATDELIGTTALTDLTGGNRSALFRIVIGEKDRWGRGYGTEATLLIAWEAFTRLGLGQIRLEVFRHNERAIGAYRRVGFREVDEHVEWVGRTGFELHVVDMLLDREDFFARQAAETGEREPVPAADDVAG